MATASSFILNPQPTTGQGAFGAVPGQLGSPLSLNGFQPLSFRIFRERKHRSIERYSVATQRNTFAFHHERH